MALMSSLPQRLPPLASLPGPARANGAVQQRCFVKRLMVRFGVPAADVEDAAQDVFLISCRRQLDLTGSEDRHGWLYLTARYVGLNRRRSLRREAARRSFPRAAEIEPEPEDRGARPDEWLASRQLCQLLAEACEQLSAEQRSALGALLQGNGVAEIALEQGTPVATISSRVRVSRLALRRHLHRRGWPASAALPAVGRAA